MEKRRKEVLIIEPSTVIVEGLVSSISKWNADCSFFFFDSLDELALFSSGNEKAVVLMNPALILNRQDDFVKMKSNHPGFQWVGIVYALFDRAILRLFDDVFSITDDVSDIIAKVNNGYSDNVQVLSDDEPLSERESEVLGWLAQGLSNKEVADKLFLSIHTVQTHRKNIMNKTGIRSLAGLTIFAVSKGIVGLE